LCAVAEVVADSRLKDLRHERCHIAKTGNHLRRIVSWDVDDLADIEIELESVSRPHSDRGQIGVQLVCFRLAVGPVEDHIGSWNVLYIVGVRVDRIFAWIERFNPYALLTSRDQVRVLELLTGDVFAVLTYV